MYMHMHIYIYICLVLAFSCILTTTCLHTTISLHCYATFRKGWNDVLVSMEQGEIASVILHPSKGYGKRGSHGYAHVE